ncbi:MAG: plastocyanin/azurin family copper-binding protein [Haloferacaceae archaeon]
MNRDLPPDRCDRRTALRYGGAALLALPTAGCVTEGSSTPTVEMAEGFAFVPETVTVTSGATVRWENESEVSHTVTAYGERIPDDAEYFASGGFDSERAARNHVTGGLVGPGGSYEHTFMQSGTYEYFCTPHEGSGMVGSVRVK